ncbi:hypothetical protein PRIPAC_75467 [Pristionchus pacificus]|uniref:Uncharacterized protein n=1 Tax=Pristionchus pacificus TaxID=54126 RepID=A0A2A6CGF8_PRIPA|nr:hypothetical protein PRIPAC_75467 [Pristionchus pacificus]|eukprot:PDM77167.1 hypothetical protein PRIPAC_43079 [Pristionchus pacificus]
MLWIRAARAFTRLAVVPCCTPLVHSLPLHYHCPAHLFGLLCLTAATDYIFPAPLLFSSSANQASVCAALLGMRKPDQRMIRVEGFRSSLLVFFSILLGSVVTPSISSGSKLLQLPRDSMIPAAPNCSSIDDVREDVIDDRREKRLVSLYNGRIGESSKVHIMIFDCLFLLTVTNLLPLRPSPYSLNWERRRRFSLLNEKWKGRNCRVPSPECPEELLTRRGGTVKDVE